MRSAKSRTFATPQAFGKIAEHGRVVGAVAGKDEAVFFGIEIDAQSFANEAPRHGELVVVAEPAVDVDGGNLGDGAGLGKELHDAVDLRGRERRHVLAEIDRQIRLAIELVRGDRRARHLRQDLCAELRQPPPVLCPLRG